MPSQKKPATPLTLLTKAAKARQKKHARVFQKYQQYIETGAKPNAVVDALAKEFGIARRTVYNIINRQRQADI